MKARVLSGVQPTGHLHLGNYLGALKNWAEIQSQYESIFCIVDLHAITAYQRPAELAEKIRETAALFIAAGIDPKQSSVVVQSSIPGHAELAWMLTCVTPVGWLQRMTQFKSKSDNQETIGDGLLQYPVLMAADILLYQANIVPVRRSVAASGADARHCTAFQRVIQGNVRYAGNTATSRGARIMALDDPSVKMSKSATGTNHAIALLDKPEIIRKKIARATTDSEPAVDPENMGAGVANLFTMAHACDSSVTKESVAGLRYGDFKKRVAEAIISRLEPIQARYREIATEPNYIDGILREGRDRVMPIANDTVRTVKSAMGLYVSF